MRVRPFFWLLLICVSAGTLLLAINHVPSTPALLRVQVERHTLVAQQPAIMELQLTDPQGIPISDATITPSARMTNMDMPDYGSQVHLLSNGRYQIQIHLSMAGPWEVTISTNANGFAPQKQTLYVEVA